MVCRSKVCDGIAVVINIIKGDELFMTAAVEFSVSNGEFDCRESLPAYMIQPD